MYIDYKVIGHRIKDSRRKQNLTQDALAEKLNVSVGYISQVERGITKISLDLLANISTILNCDMGELVSGTPHDGKDYLTDEFIKEFYELNSKERKIVLELITILKKER